MTIAPAPTGPWVRPQPNLATDPGPQPSTGSFPTVGESAAAHQVTPVLSGTLVARKGAAGGALEAATANHRANIEEHLGAQLAPTATLYAANAAEASATYRNVKIVPSAVGNRDFYDKRATG